MSALVRETCRYCKGRGYKFVVNGKRLRQIRTLRGLSLRELARRAKVSAAYMSDIELGRRQPAEATRFRIEQALR